MQYSIPVITNKTITLDKKKLQPLNKFRELNHLDIMLLEDYLNKYNNNLNTFSFKQLVTKLERNCTIYGKGPLSKGEAQVSDSYIYEKISRHYTEHISGKEKDASKLNKDPTVVDINRKYTIYLAVDNRNISGYFPDNNRRPKYRRKKLQKRYSYSNPLNRIHGFTIIDDNPCVCKPVDQKYLSIVVICANPFSSRSNIKAVGSYILMFLMILAYEYKFHKIILEVTNNKAIYDNDSDSDEGDTESEDGGTESEDDDIESEDGGTESEDGDTESEDDIDPDTHCCEINITKNLYCSEDIPEYDNDDIIDKYPYIYRAYELETEYYKNDLLELCNCYSIPCSTRLKVKDIIKKILHFEYWNFPEYENNLEDIDCMKDFKVDDYIDHEDYEKWKYGGPKYQLGKDSTKNLYCRFYEKHGFRENPLLNTKYRCFKKDPLPSMEIITENVHLTKLIRVFFEKKYLDQLSDYCGKVPSDRILQ